MDHQVSRDPHSTMLKGLLMRFRLHVHTLSFASKPPTSNAGITKWIQVAFPSSSNSGNSSVFFLTIKLSIAEQFIITFLLKVECIMLMGSTNFGMHVIDL